MQHSFYLDPPSTLYLGPCIYYKGPYNPGQGYWEDTGTQEFCKRCHLIAALGNVLRLIHTDATPKP